MYSLRSERLTVAESFRTVPCRFGNGVTFSGIGAGTSGKYFLAAW